MTECGTFVSNGISFIATITLCGLYAVFGAGCIIVGYIIGEAVTECRYNFLCGGCIITTRAMTAFGETGCSTGRSDWCIVYHIMTKCFFFNHCCVITTGAGVVCIPTGFGTGGSLCIMINDSMVIGIGFSCQNGNNCCAVLVGEVFGAIRAGPIFDGAGFNTGCSDCFVVILVLMVDCFNFFVTGNISFTICTVNTDGVTDCGAGFCDCIMVFGVDVVICIATDFFGFGMACVILTAVGLEPHLMTTGNGCDCAVIPRMCLGINSNAQSGDCVCTCFVREVLLTIRAEPVFDGAFVGTSGSNSLVVYLIFMADCFNFFVTGDPLVTIFAECTGGVADSSTGFILLFMIGCGDMVRAVLAKGFCFCMPCIIFTGVGLHATYRAGSNGCDLSAVPLVVI